MLLKTSRLARVLIAPPQIKTAVFAAWPAKAVRPGFNGRWLHHRICRPRGLGSRL